MFISYCRMQELTHMLESLIFSKSNHADLGCNRSDRWKRLPMVSLNFRSEMYFTIRHTSERNTYRISTDLLPKQVISRFSTC